MLHLALDHNVGHCYFHNHTGSLHQHVGVSFRGQWAEIDWSASLWWLRELNALHFKKTDTSTHLYIDLTTHAANIRSPHAHLFSGNGFFYRGPMRFKDFSSNTLIHTCLTKHTKECSHCRLAVMTLDWILLSEEEERPTLSILHYYTIYIICRLRLCCVYL